MSTPASPHGTTSPKGGPLVPPPPPAAGRRRKRQNDRRGLIWFFALAIGVGAGIGAYQLAPGLDEQVDDWLAQLLT